MQLLLTRFVHRINLLAWLYITAITLWLLLRQIFFDQFWWLALANTFALALFVPLAVLLPWSLLRRQGRLLLGLSIPLGALLWFYGSVLLPPLPPAQTTPPELTIMSYNVLWDNRDYDRLAAAIAAERPDIVALQELRPEHLQALTERIGADYPYYLMHEGTLFHSVGVLSRFPLDAVDQLPGSPLRRGLKLELSPNGRPLSVIVVHLTPTNMLAPHTIAERYAYREAEVRELVRLTHAAQQPVLVLCDCNFTPTSEAYALLSAELSDSFVAVGRGLGHTFLVSVHTSPSGLVYSAP